MIFLLGVFILLFAACCGYAGYEIGKDEERREAKQRAAQQKAQENQ